jgi:hypothetical protein
MTIDRTSGVAVVTAAPTTQDHHSYVDWPAILAGILLTTAISILLLTFGSAIGLSFTDFSARDDANPIWIAIAAGSWLLWVQISSYMAGGYLTGRLRRRIGDATEHESDVRDGAHGLLVWAGSAVIGALLAVAGIGAAVSTAGNVAATVTQAASTVAGEAASAIDPNAYFVDTLLRPATPAPGQNADAARGEIGRILAQGATTGEIAEPDRAYVAQVVAANTGLSEADARARVDQTITAIDTARQQAVETAEAARRTTVVGAFLIAASLLVSAIGAYWAATKGGNHRDEGTVFADVFRRF